MPFHSIITAKAARLDRTVLTSPAFVMRRTLLISSLTDENMNAIGMIRLARWNRACAGDLSQLVVARHALHIIVESFRYLTWVVAVFDQFGKSFSHVLLTEMKMM